MSYFNSSSSCTVQNLLDGVYSHKIPELSLKLIPPIRLNFTIDIIGKSHYRLLFMEACSQQSLMPISGPICNLPGCP